MPTGTIRKVLVTDNDPEIDIFGCSVARPSPPGAGETPVDLNAAHALDVVQRQALLNVISGAAAGEPSQNWK
jgi:hypothetical protein